MLLGHAGAQLAGAARRRSRATGASTWPGSDGRGFLVVRLRASGAADRSFGRSGRLTVRLRRRATRAGARDVALFRDGRILVAGTVTLGGVQRFAVARLQPGGNLDPNFGVDGVGGRRPAGRAARGDGAAARGRARAGRLGPGAARRRAVLVMRLLADGTPDPGFGSGGAVDSTAVKLAGRARDVLVLPDGRIALAAAAERGRAARATFLAARLTAAGAFDPTFDGDGVARVATTTRRVRGGGAAAIALDRRGRLLLAGTARGGGGRDDATVVRLTAGRAAGRELRARRRRAPDRSRAGARCGSSRCAATRAGGSCSAAAPRASAPPSCGCAATPAATAPSAPAGCPPAGSRAPAPAALAVRGDGARGDRRQRPDRRPRQPRGRTPARALTPYPRGHGRHHLLRPRRPVPRHRRRGGPQGGRRSARSPTTRAARSPTGPRSATSRCASGSPSSTASSPTRCSSPTARCRPTRSCSSCSSGRATRSSSSRRPTTARC